MQILVIITNYEISYYSFHHFLFIISIGNIELKKYIYFKMIIKEQIISFFYYFPIEPIFTILDIYDNILNK
jgi:hypothetical protein